MNVPLEVTYLLALLFYAQSILLHVFVIRKVIPFTDVNGGRSNSYEEQKKQSIVSIIVLVVMVLYVVLTLVIPGVRETVIFIILTSILILFFTLGIVMQLLGTDFEKKLVVYLNLLGVFSHVLLLMIGI